MQIIKAPNPVLSRPTKKVAKINKEVLYLIKEMKQALSSTHDPEGVGLAAPQVGKPLQLFITRPNTKSKIQVFINPSIISQNNAESDSAGTFDSAAKPNAEQRRNKIQRSSASGSARFSNNHTQLEGCLSLPNIWGEIKRSQIIELSFLDENGKPHKRKFSGFAATIVQHEYDHLNGILFPKRVLEQKGKLYKSHKNKEGKDVFEEMEL